MADDRQSATVGSGSGSIKIAPDLAWKLRIITNHNGSSMASFLDPVIRAPIEKEFRRVADSLKAMAAGKN